MDEYIDKEKALLAKFTVTQESEYARGWNDALDAIVENAIVTGVAPVVHGEWLCAETDDEQFFLCSVCNNKEYWESNYCPECGAKMDAKQEESTNGKQHDAE